MANIKSPTGESSQRLSRVIGWACLALAAVLPVAALISAVQTEPVQVLTQFGIRMPPGVAPATMTIAPWQQIAAIFTSLIPVGAVAYALLRARQCFEGFVRGETFSLSTVRHLRGFAAGLLVSSCAGLVAPTVIVLLLTWAAPAGGHVLTVSFGSQQLLMLLFAGIVWQMGHAMTRAVQIAEDNAQFI